MIEDWALAWGVPAAAIYDLRARMAADMSALEAAGGAEGLEAAASAAVRVAAARAGWRLWRNNVGALPDARGRWIRYGLANDSAAVNARFKSGDLIGIRPVVIGPDHMGRTIGQFVSRECKRPGWAYKGTDREVAQLAWMEFINAMGGDARFTTGEL